MSSFVRKFGRRSAAIALVTALAVTSTASVFAQDDLSSLAGEIISDGSSTVGPITQAVAEEFAADATGVQVSVDISGTGGGFKRFCAGETDVQNASRAIKEEEAKACADAGVKYLEFEVAYDGLTLVVNENNETVTCLDMASLTKLWQKESPAMTWADLNAEWPAEPIALYGPGTDSGTFDYFVETVLGKEGEIREDFTPSEDDNVLVEGVANDENAFGYFGYAYYVENEDSLNAVAVDNGEGCVAPSEETIQDGTYAPLSRPLYIYVSEESLARPEVQAFVAFYLDMAGELATDVGFVASPDDVYAADVTELETFLTGGAEATPAS